MMMSNMCERSTSGATVDNSISLLSSQQQHASMSPRRPQCRPCFTALCGIILCLCAIFTVGCETVPTEVKDSISSAELFRLAQDAYNLNLHNTALFYYDVIIERFRADRYISLSAQYEIAFIHFRLGRLELARAMLEDILTEYQRSRNNFPQWVWILSRKIYDQIVEADAGNGA